MYSHSYCSITTFPVRSLFGNTYITLSKNRNHLFHNIRGCVYFVGSCNGLLYLLGYFYTNSTYIEVLLYLWNPATRTLSNKIVFLPDEEDRFDERCWQFAFGYDNSRDIYKIVALRHNKVRIFNVGEDNVWRNIQSFPVVPLDNSIYFPFHDLATNCGVYVSGAINWVALDSESEYYQFEIISLDLSTETYRRLKPPPHSVFYEMPHGQQNLAVLMDSLCFSYDFNRTHFTLWQMKEYGVEDSWTPLLQFSYQSLSIDDDLTWFPLGLSENDGILILAVPRKHDDMPAFLYNIRDNRVEQKTRITNPMKWYLARYYVESLVSPC